MASEKEKQTTLDDSSTQPEESSSGPKEEKSKNSKKDREEPTSQKKEERSKEESSNEKATTEEKEQEEPSADKESNVALELNKQHVFKIATILGAIALTLLIGTALLNQQQTTTEEVSPDTVLATVAGQDITQADLDEQQQLLQSLGTQQLPNEEALELLIDEEVLYLEAQERGLVVSREEAEQQLEEDLDLAGTTVDAYRQQLAERNIEFEQLVEYLRKQLSIANVLDEELQNITPTQDEIEQRYNESQENYRVPTTATVRQILLSSDGENETVLQEAKNIRAELEEDLSLFCDYVENRTADEASIETCGEYNVTEQDPFIDEFKDAALNMSVGELRIVHSDFGYHILVKDDELPERLQSLEEVRTQIEQQLRQEAEQDRIPQIAQELREKHGVSYPGEETESTDEIAPQPEQNETQEEVEPLEETEEVEPVEETQETAEEMPEDSEELADLSQCLAEADATVYIVDWSPESQDQQVILGNLQESVTVINCEDQREECDRNGVNAYPTWELNGEQTIGLKTRTSLRNTLSCN